jgi:ABC-type multidrug transport system permease subunit
MVGLLLGGTWAAWTVPNDVSISVYHAFASHLESFWQETLMLTLATTLAGFCCAYFAEHHANVR